MLEREKDIDKLFPDIQILILVLIQNTDIDRERKEKKKVLSREKT